MRELITSLAADALKAMVHFQSLSSDCTMYGQLLWETIDRRATNHVV